MRHTMALPRSELTAQTLPGSWGWKGRGPAGHRAGPCVSGTGMVWEGIPDRRAHCRCPQGRPVFDVPGCWPLGAPVLRQAGKQGAPGPPFRKSSEQGPCPHQCPTYLCQARAHRAAASLSSSSSGQPTPVAVVCTASPCSAAACAALTVTA